MGRKAYFAGLGGLFRLAPNGDAPRATCCEELVGVDLVGPAEEVLLRVVLGGAVDRGTVRLGKAGIRVPSFERGEALLDR